MALRRILLDTSAYSAFMRGDEGVKTLLQDCDEIGLTPVVLGELYAGFARGRNRRKNLGELKRFRASPRVRLFSVDDQTAERYAVIVGALRKAGTPIPTNDVWIAASAMQHGLAVVTTDAHFERVSQILVERLPA